jgi:hypothetical protein
MRSAQLSSAAQLLLVELPYSTIAAAHRSLKKKTTTTEDPQSKK